MAIPESIMARFWEKVDKNGPTPEHVPEIGNCWIWTRKPSSRGYGSFHLFGRARCAHRFAWSSINGPVPQGLFVLHHCDNRMCVRPDHLWLGTHADNMADMRAKGRESKGERHKSRTHPETVTRGVRHHNAKFTPDLVREVRARYKGGESAHVIARAVGMSHVTVWLAATGRTWKHVV